MIHYPTLNLFLYDLHEGLGQNDKEIQQNKEIFLKKLPDNTKIFEESNELEYLELLSNPKTIRFQADSPKHDGYYYPVLLNDSYGLLLNYSLKLEQDETNLTWLENLQKLVAGKVNNQAGTLGETWFLSGQIDDLENSENIAENCCQTLFPQDEFIKVGKSDFLEGIIFEFNNLTKHVLIAFYPSETSLKQETDFYPDWMRLLFYRYKIMWAYNQSRELVRKLKQGATQIQICEQNLRASMDTDKLKNKQLQTVLNQVWQILADYATDLDKLNDQTYTIAINLDNYEKRLIRLVEKSESSLTKLQKFHIISKEKYLPQVQQDYKAFSPKLRRLENLINYIRTRVAIQEEVREQKFQNTIATWGIGLAFGAIVASISGQFPTASETCWTPAVISLLISLLAVMIGRYATKIVLWFMRRK